MRKEIGKVFRELCEPFGLALIEGHALAEHVRTRLSITPKFSVAIADGMLKSLFAILIHPRGLVRTKHLACFHF